MAEVAFSIYYPLFKRFEKLLLLAIILAYAFLMYMALKVRFTSFIKNYPMRFVTELLLFSLLPAIPLYVFVDTRGISKRDGTMWFAGLWLKFAALHVLFELSGVYNYYFGNNRT